MVKAQVHETSKVKTSKSLFSYITLPLRPKTYHQLMVG